MLIAIPFYVSSALAGVLAAYLMTSRRRGSAPYFFFGLSVLTLAVLNMFTALQLEGMLPSLTASRPVLTATIPALLYLHLQNVCKDPRPLATLDAIHAIGPIAVAGLILLPVHGLKMLLDPTLTMIWFGYIALSLRMIFKTSPQIGDVTEFIKLQSPTQWPLIIVGWMTAVAVLDVIIFTELNSFNKALSHSITLNLTGIALATIMGGLVVLSLHKNGPVAWITAYRANRSDTAKDMMKFLELKMHETSAYLDPELTLSRFAKRIKVPARHISETINDSRRQNFNRWVNHYRVLETQRLIIERPSATLTNIFFQAGFHNKSTFNAAFKASTGQSPSAWRQENT